MNSGNRWHRRIATLASVLAVAAGVGGPAPARAASPGDRVNVICVIAGDISYCAPDGR